MANFLFWNVGGKALHKEVASLAADLDIDVILLAESKSDDLQMHRALAREMPEVPFEVAPLKGCRKLGVYLRFSSKFWRPCYDAPRFLIAEYAPPAKRRILVAAAHLPSRPYTSTHSINLDCVEFASKIREVEAKLGTLRTVVVGDLNLSPFDDGVVGASGLHGVMSKRLAQQERRTVNGQNYEFFYNPMWGRFGDTSPGPPGSYFYRGSEHVAHFWHTYDQVLLRPSLLNEYREESLRIVTKIRGTSLLEKGIPSSRIASDHLPLTFNLELLPEIASDAEERPMAR